MVYKDFKQLCCRNNLDIINVRQNCFKKLTFYKLICLTLFLPRFKLKSHKI